MIRLTLGLAALGSLQWKRPLCGILLNLRKRRTEPLNCCPFMTSFGPLLTRNRVPPPNPTLVPSGKYQSPRSVRTIPDSVPQQSTRSVMHCNAASSLAGFLLDGIEELPYPTFMISSKSTKLSLGKITPRNLRETPAVKEKGGQPGT